MRIALLAALAALALLPGCPGDRPSEPGPSEEPMQVGFIYVGPVGDAGWTYAHEQGRLDLERTFSWVKTARVESVEEGAGAERVLTQLGEKGYDLVFTTSFGFMDPTLKIAERYPDTVFMHCSGYKRAANVGTYFGRMYQAKYLAGMIAGLMTRSGRIGYVAPHPIPEVIRHIDGFTLGVRAVNPEATVHVVWTNDWFNPPVEKAAADALLDGGADILAAGTDSAAPLQAAAARGAFAIGYDSDSRHYAPKAFLTAPIWDWSVVYRDVAQKVRDGTWQPVDYWNGLESGVVKLAPLSDLVPAEVKERVAQATADIVAGKLVVFAGPVKGQDGSVICPEGQVIPDADLLKLDRFVEGVVGDIPK